MKKSFFKISFILLISIIIMHPIQNIFADAIHPYLSTNISENSYTTASKAFDVTENSSTELKIPSEYTEGIATIHFPNRATEFNLQYIDIDNNKVIFNESFKDVGKLVTECKMNGTSQYKIVITNLDGRLISGSIEVKYR